MERSSRNFHLVKQLVTQNVRINFCPHKPEIQNSETMINLAGTARWQLCGAREEWPVNCVPCVRGVLIHCPSDRRQWETQRGELGGSTCEFNKPSMRSTASLGFQGCQWSCFPPFRTWVYFSRLERNKTMHTEMGWFGFEIALLITLLIVRRPPFVCFIKENYHRGIKYDLLSLLLALFISLTNRQWY